MNILSQSLGIKPGLALAALLALGINSFAQTADNGLNIFGTNNVQLGGTLIKSTIIDQGNGFDLHFNKNGGRLFSIYNDGTIGIGANDANARINFTDVDKSNYEIGLSWLQSDPTRYGIHRTFGTWLGPDYQQLRVGWNTGIILDPGSQFGKSYVDVQGNGLRVTTGGVGIGTTNPGTYAMAIERDNINGDQSNFPAIRIRNINSTLVNGNGYNVAGVDYSAGNDAVLGQCYANYGVASKLPWSGGSGFYVATRTEHPIIFVTGTASTEKARITASGNLLLGTTTDNDMKLQVKGYGCFIGPVGTGIATFWGDNNINRAMGINSYGNPDGSARYTAIGHNMWEAGSMYATANQGGGIYLDDRNGTLPIRFMYKKAGEDPSSQAGGVSAAGNFVFGAANDDNGNKLQITGNTWASGKLQVGTSSYNDQAPYTPEIWDTYNTRFNGGNVSIFAPGDQSTGNSYQLNFYARYHDGGRGDITSKSSYIKGTVTTYRESEPQPWEGRGTLVLGSTNTTYMPATGFTDVPAMYLYNGKVGVGVSVPESQLHTNGTVRFAGLTNDNAKDRVVVSDANGNLSYREASTLGGSSTAGWSLTGNNDANAKLGTIGSNDLPIITGNVEQMRIGANGNVGIGTTAISGNYKLSVEGTIRTRKVRVDPGTWADYVFESDYKLRPLKEVEQYIQQEKHLPEVPSAAEVKKEGLDLGDNQAVLLKKIEELTLYVIQQQKQLEAQQQKIENLEKKVNEKK
jgi:hypothetical protein